VQVTFISLRAAEPLAFGLMSLGAALRERGHDVGIEYGRTAAELGENPRIQTSQVLAMSATTGLHRVYVGWAEELRARFPDKGLFLGGPHPTFFPEVIEAAPLDGVCIGEGEESFPEAIDAWQRGFPEVPAGFSIRRDGGRGPVEHGPARAPVRDLDRLPPPAYDLFLDDPHYRRLPIRVFMPTRGCPYRCTYCYNRTLNDRYRPYGRLVRVTDPERVLDDIESVQRRWGLELVWFLDANFVADKRWLEAFTGAYRRRTSLPFFCKLRPERATERVVRLLARAGCVGVGLGIECGTERIRRDVLGRNVPDSAILAGCRRLKQSGIRIMSFNMLAIPGESFDDGLRTLALNVACGVDHAGATILQPYPATELARRGVAEGWFDGQFDRLGASYFAGSQLRMDPSERDRFTNLQRLFSLAVEFPEIRAHIRWLCSRRPNRFYRLLFTQRQDWMLRRVFYRAKQRESSSDYGRSEQLLASCRELGIPPSGG
jgi:radical SAM superfamily enzyme YgiQ (UPF0313 family)